MTTASSKGAADPWRILARSTGVCGLLGVLLVFAAVSTTSALGEPEFDGTREQAVAFFRNAGDSAWYHASPATFAVGMLALLWFFVGVTALLRRAEGEPAWRSTAALLSGTLFIAVSTVVDVSWVAAAHRGSDTDPAVALFAFDVGNIGLATAWVAMAGFALATGWILLDTGVLPRWCAWWAIATGVGLIVARVRLGVRLLVPAVLRVLGRCRRSRRPPDQTWASRRRTPRRRSWYPGEVGDLPEQVAMRRGLNSRPCICGTPALV